MKWIEEEALLYLIANSNNWSEVFYSGSSCSNDDDDIDDLYNELYDSLIKSKKELKLANNKIEM